jgi:hypothetical protein
VASGSNWPGLPVRGRARKLTANSARPSAKVSLRRPQCRPHSSLNDATPDEHYFTHLPAPAMAA